MTTAAISTKGTQLLVEDTPSSGTFTAIAEVKSFDGPSRENPDLDASSFDSTEQEFIGGLATPGELQCTLNHLGANTMHQRMEDDVPAGTRRNYKLVFFDGTTRAFLAKVKTFTPSGGTNAIIETKVAFKLSGAITRTGP